MCLHMEMSTADKKDASPETCMDIPSLGNGAMSRLVLQHRRASVKRRRPRRVLYPAQVKKYLPREEKDAAMKWLRLLGAVILLQIFWEDAIQEEMEFQTMAPIGIIDSGLFNYANVPPKTRPPLAELVMENASKQLENASHTPVLFYRTVDPEEPAATLSRDTNKDREDDSVQ